MKSQFTTITPNGLNTTETYKLLIGSVVPRPIAWVCTQNKTGQTNLAPFSFYNAVCSNPPTLLFSIARNPDGSKKDTLRNIEETHEFVVHSVSEHNAEAMNQTSANYEYGVSEIEKVGLHTIPSLSISTPRIQEAAIQMECKLTQTVEIGNGGAGSSTIVIGEILQFHFDSRVYQNGKVLLDKLKPISRLAGFGYAKVNDTFELPRPKVLNEEKQ